ncbi:MAG: CerR family C-terminal domain-containing protein [Planctomycetota bacterium]
MPGSDTALKKRLLDVAVELFIKQGYRQTSLRQIAERAGVSHGSVRYHFGSKDALYEASIDRLAPEAISSFFPDVPDASAMTRDQAIALFKEQVLTLATIKARIGEYPQVAMSYIQGEGEPGAPPNPAFYRKVIAPGHLAMKRTIRAIRPDIEDDETLEIMTFNVIFQCVMLRIGRGVILKRLKKKTLSRSDTERIAHLIAEVSLAGIESVSP